MTDGAATPATFRCDSATRALVRLAARIANGTEEDVREALRETTSAGTSAAWVEEVMLQSYLFCGFPRAINAWRVLRDEGGGVRVLGDEWGGGRSAGARDGGTGGVLGAGDELEHLARGEVTCAAVYGSFYAPLRRSIRALHPLMDEWMVIEGYGKVLSRPGLDLGRRELCIIAACVASGQERQLHSHLHGARNVGVPDETISQSIEALAGTVDDAHLASARAMWVKVSGTRADGRTNHSE